MTGRVQNWAAGWPRIGHGAAALALTAALGACTTLPGANGLGLGGGSAPVEAPTAPTAARPEPDANGVITYPTYQVAVARSGDSVATIAARLGLNAQALASTNGLPVDATLRPGELVLLSSRVATAGPAASGSAVNVASIAGPALDRAEASGTTSTTSNATIRPAGSAPSATGAAEPTRHTVSRGESAYSIARRYNVSVRALADWNGLGSDLAVREGQVLLIPVATGPVIVETEVVSLPGAGSAAPVPPSSAAPQPDQNLPSTAQAVAAGTAATAAGSGQNLAGQQTSASDTTRLAQPVAGGRIIRGYAPGSNEGLDFAASGGSPVRAAEAGTVAAITTDVDQVPIVVIRHSNNLLTVYANVDGITVAKGATVARGQQIASVRDGDSPFLHFEVRQGFDSVDPLDYLAE